MKPSASAPYDGAPAAWVVASGLAEADGRVGRGLAGLDPAQDQALLVDGEHLGHRHPVGLARASGARVASQAKKPAGGWAWVFMIAVVPSESRSLVADEVSPPARGAVATTDEPRSSSACRATQGLAGHASSGCCWSAATSAPHVRSTIASTSSKPCSPP